MEKRRFRVTHPFHPLHGREFELVEMSSVLGTGVVHYTDEEGTLRTIPQSFTSAAAGDPFVRAAAGRSAFRVPELLELSALLESLEGDDCAGEDTGGGAETVKEIMPHV